MDQQDADTKAFFEQEKKVSEALVIPSHILEMKEYAGEKRLRNRHREIEYFKMTGEYPEHLFKAKAVKNRSVTIKHFLMSAHNHQMTEFPVSPISESKLCIMMKSATDLRVIPYKSEIESVFNALHIENGEHLNVKQTRLRAASFKIHWPGLTNDLELLCEDCICNQVKSMKRKTKK